jgi:hypothetical protein
MSFIVPERHGVTGAAIEAGQAVQGTAGAQIGTVS